MQFFFFLSCILVCSPFFFPSVLYVYDGKDDEFWGMQGWRFAILGIDKRRQDRYPGLYYDYQDIIEAELRCIR